MVQTTKRALIIEDSKLIAKFIKMILSQCDTPWEPVHAADAESAITCIESGEPFDLITVDINLPGTSGLELLPTLRSKCEESQIVIITGNIQKGVREAAEKWNAKFIEKPIDPEQLTDIAQSA